MYKPAYHNHKTRCMASSTLHSYQKASSSFAGVINRGCHVHEKNGFSLKYLYRTRDGWNQRKFDGSSNERQKLVFRYCHTVKLRSDQCLANINKACSFSKILLRQDCLFGYDILLILLT
jgi:hypothetical protein